jgi:hypothetical protein
MAAPSYSCSDALRPAVQRTGRRAFFVLLVILVALWAVAMVFRWELRAQWWAYQLSRSATVAEHDFYVIRLASIRDKSQHAVGRLMKDQRPEVREAAVTILRFCEQPRATDRLFALLADDTAEVAAMAAMALAWQPDANRHVPRLRETLSAAMYDDGRRWGHAVALGRIGGPDAEAALCDALAGSCAPDVKAQLIDSLGLLGCRQAVPLMIDALGDHRPVTTLPHSQLSARRAIQALQSELLSKGADPLSALAASTSEPTVAGVATRWIQLLAEPAANSSDTHPATP